MITWLLTTLGRAGRESIWLSVTDVAALGLEPNIFPSSPHSLFYLIHHCKLGIGIRGIRGFLLISEDRL